MRATKVGPRRVCLSASTLPHAGVGGVWSVVRGLVKGLGQLDGPEEYVVVARRDVADELLRDRGANTSVVFQPDAPSPEGPLRLLARRAVGAARRRLLRPLAPASATRAESDVFVPAWSVSTGFYEALGVGAIHFPWPRFVVTAIPSVLTCHDIQHRHHPEFFSPLEVAAREAETRLGLGMASLIAVGANGVRSDLEEQFGTPGSRIAVVPWAALSELQPEPTEEEVRVTLCALDLEAPFALYPAMTWPHKNHQRLIEAVALAVQRGERKIHLVCTGHQHPTTWPSIVRCLESTGVGRHVRFLGMVDDRTLQCLYSAARFLFFPSLFEGGGLPIYEAWCHGLAVAASRASVLPELIGDAGYFFDPESVADMASSLTRLANDDDLIKALSVAGRMRSVRFTWVNTARLYRALYRRVAGWPLAAEDRDLLAFAISPPRPPGSAAHDLRTP